MTEEIVYNYLQKYESLVKYGARAMQTVIGLDKLYDYRRKKVPRQGVIKFNEEDIGFRFHGGSCEFDFSGVLVNFELTPPNESHVNFTVWDVYVFIKTSDKEANLDEDTCRSIINKLEIKGLVKKTTDALLEVPPHYGIYTLT
jgi:hypothetical protein